MMRHATGTGLWIGGVVVATGAAAAATAAYYMHSGSGSSAPPPLPYHSSSSSVTFVAAATQERYEIAAIAVDVYEQARRAHEAIGAVRWPWTLVAAQEAPMSATPDQSLAHDTADKTSSLRLLKLIESQFVRAAANDSKTFAELKAEVDELNGILLHQIRLWQYNVRTYTDAAYVNSADILRAFVAFQRHVQATASHMDAYLRANA